jgi:hypothetical protein
MLVSFVGFGASLIGGLLGAGIMHWLKPHIKRAALSKDEPLFIDDVQPHS